MKWSADPRILRDPVHFVAFGFGTGLSPVAPGTFGTLVGVLLVWLVAPHGPMVHLAVVGLGFALGVYVCGESARRLGVHDHGGIVWDEVIGYAITMAAVPPDPLWLLAGFALFRFFDILKPWPIREADHSLKGGLGIMLDDVLAGIFAGTILYLAHLLL